MIQRSMSELGIATSGISKGALEHHDRFRPLCRSTRRVRAYGNLATPDERSWRGLGVRVTGAGFDRGVFSRIELLVS